MAHTQQAALIINTTARRGRQWLRPAVETLRRVDIDLVETHAARHPQDMLRLAKDAVGAEIPLVIIGGGDGTLAGVAPYFVGSNSTLGVLPLGTGNQFARDLGIQADIDAACRVIAAGKVARVDLGSINAGHFLNVATVGLTTQIAEGMTVQAKRGLGRVAYLFALLRALRIVRPFSARLVTENEDHTFETLQVVVGNGRFHAGPFPLAPDASITDGKLVVYALVGTSRLNLLRYACNLPGGHHVDMANVPTFWTTEGRLETNPTQRVTVDGEVKLRTPVKFGIAPGALRVMVPQEFAG